MFFDIDFFLQTAVSECCVYYHLTLHDNSKSNGIWPCHRSNIYSTGHGYNQEFIQVGREAIHLHTKYMLKTNLIIKEETFNFFYY